MPKVLLLASVAARSSVIQIRRNSSHRNEIVKKPNFSAKLTINPDIFLFIFSHSVQNL